MRFWIVLACLLISMSTAQSAGQMTSREEKIARVKKGLATWREGGKIWTARVKQVPDYGFDADTWNYDGESQEGTFYVQFPGRYSLRWDNNSQVYADGGKIAIYNGGTRVEDLDLTETPFWLLVNGEIGQNARVQAVTEEEMRLAGKVQKILAVDLEPAEKPYPYKNLRLYFPATGEPTLLGFRLPAAARSGWGPEFFNVWLIDFHPELADEAVFRAP